MALTPAQKAKAREADARRYKRSKAKRIAAEKTYQAKEKAAHPEIFKARAKINNAVAAGKLKKPGPDYEFHHDGTYNEKGVPKGHWVKRSKHRRLPDKGKKQGLHKRD